MPLRWPNRLPGGGIDVLDGKSIHAPKEWRREIKVGIKWQLEKIHRHMAKARKSFELRFVEKMALDQIVRQERMKTNDVGFSLRVRKESNERRPRIEVELDDSKLQLPREGFGGFRWKPCLGAKNDQLSVGGGVPVGVKTPTQSQHKAGGNDTDDDFCAIHFAHLRERSAPGHSLSFAWTLVATLCLVKFLLVFF